MSDTNPVVNSETLDDGVCLQLGGDIDLAKVPDVRNSLMQIIKGKPARLVVDLGDVPYMDSSGVATLVEALQKQRKGGNKMILCNLQPKVLSIFEIVRLDKVFLIVEDLEKAKTA